jgi:hypothetical protein
MPWNSSDALQCFNKARIAAAIKLIRAAGNYR